MKTSSLLNIVSATAVTFGTFALAAPCADAATLVGHWDLNEGSPAATTTSQTPSGTVSADFSTATGLAWGGTSGGALGSTDFLSFNGGNANNTLNTNVSGAVLGGVNATAAKTFVAWINVDAGADYSGIISYSPQGGTTNGADLRFLIDNGGTLRGEVTGGSFTYSGMDLRGAGWQMVAAVFGDGTNPSNTNNSKFYIGGTGFVTPDGVGAKVIDTSDTTAEGGIYSEINIVIGASHAPGSGFKGGIDEVWVYNGALTLNELNALYQPIPEPTALALLGFGSLIVLGFRSRRHCRVV